ncbi:hypothetical protein [Falsihalocynthiibacter arcticus]|uniref:Uncharacterized protein n=1 Tax=Falsihalocynthiibacter arcticus TaxID=1579316 RepID=A0A126V335_9RHOB|nr:hypothetical protein [Falsihalocynthiibacter arcticus]AML52751.1 hypothetical protein RC74_17120 [Falsihalocynthiibacter arcticus]
MEKYVQTLTNAAVSEDAIKCGKCFMCGGPASTGQGEHVFPLWLQHKYGLLNQKLTLLNGTLIPYRRLTSPCCEPCNTGPLADLERRVKVQAESYETNFENDDLRLLVGLWLFKILFGIIHAECRFSYDQSDPSLGSIFPPKFADELHSLHLLVNSHRKPTVFRCLHGAVPFTVYLYRIAESRHYDLFDFSTNLFGKSVAIRMGKLGAIAVADGGLQIEAGKLGPFGLDGQELHPLQFDELVSRVHYKSVLRDATHFYLNSETKKSLLIEQVRVTYYSNVLLEDGSQQTFRDWDERELGNMLSLYTRLNIPWFDEIHRQTYTYTFLADGSRNMNFAELDEKLDKIWGIPSA